MRVRGSGSGLGLRVEGFGFASRVVWNLGAIARVSGLSWAQDVGCWALDLELRWLSSLRSRVEGVLRALGLRMEGLGSWLETVTGLDLCSSYEAFGQ